MFTDLIILALLTSGVMLCYTEAIVGDTIYLSLKPKKIFLLNCLFLSFRLFFGGQVGSWTAHPCIFQSPCVFLGL